MIGKFDFNSKINIEMYFSRKHLNIYDREEIIDEEIIDEEINDEDTLIAALSEKHSGRLYVGSEEFNSLEILLSQNIENFKIFLKCVEKSGNQCPTVIVLPGQYDSEDNEYIYLFNQKMNSRFSSETLKSILQLFASHPFAGKLFFETLLDSYGLDNVVEELVEIFFGFELFEKLQLAAIKSLSDKFVKRLQELGKFDIQTNEYYNNYFMAGNMAAMKIHVERNGVNSITNYYGPSSTALFYSRSKKIAHFLLENGADPNNLVRKDCKKWSGKDVDIASINVIRWCLEYDISIKNIVTAELILGEDKYGHLDHKSSQKYWNQAERSELDYVKLLRDFNYTIPSPVLNKYLQNVTTRGALITYSFAKCNKNEKLDRKYLRWRPFTHRHFEKSFKARVITSLLCFKRICFVPRDIRNLILESAFFEE